MVRSQEVTRRGCNVLRGHKRMELCLRRSQDEDVMSQEVTRRGCNVSGGHEEMVRFSR